MSENTLRVLLVVVSAVLTLVVLAAGWETYRQIDYARWKKEFEHDAWLGTITIPSPDKDLLWEYRPYGEHSGIRTNRFGFRDVDLVTREKPPGVYRFAFVGDSVTLAMGVDLEVSFVKRFEALANRAGWTDRRVQALNFGIDGYNTLQTRALIEARATRFDPDHVVYVMCLNDFDFRASSGFKSLYFDPPTSFLLADLETRMRKILGLGYHRYMFLKNRGKVLQAVLDMEASLRAEGREFSVLIVPVFWPDAESYSDYEEGYIHAWLGERLQEHSVVVWDALDAFRSRNLPPRSFAQDVWHLNEAGHELVAAFVAANLGTRDARRRDGAADGQQFDANGALMRRGGGTPTPPARPTPARGRTAFPRP